MNLIGIKARKASEIKINTKIKNKVLNNYALLINKEKHKHCLNMKSDERWNYVFSQANKIKRCGDETEDGCGCKQPKKIYKQEMLSNKEPFRIFLGYDKIWLYEEVDTEILKAGV